ncbi:integrase core domain-containing protein [Posidoniimonas corsicana]
MLTAAWRDDYDHERPHGSLGYRTPDVFARAAPTPLRSLIWPRLNKPLR